jgi:hypothetical protein
MQFEDLGSDERELVGQWIADGVRVAADDTCKRIEWLVAQRLEQVATGADGWDVLFRDPRDGRLWERTFPQSEMHGGGPLSLTLIAPSAASLKYRWRRLEQNSTG